MLFVYQPAELTVWTNRPSLGESLVFFILGVVNCVGFGPIGIAPGVLCDLVALRITFGQLDRLRKRESGGLARVLYVLVGPVVVASVAVVAP